MDVFASWRELAAARRSLSARAPGLHITHLAERVMTHWRSFVQVCLLQLAIQRSQSWSSNVPSHQSVVPDPSTHVLDASLHCACSRRSARLEVSCCGWHLRVDPVTVSRINLQPLSGSILVQAAQGRRTAEATAAQYSRRRLQTSAFHALRNLSQQVKLRTGSWLSRRVVVMFTRYPAPSHNLNAVVYVHYRLDSWQTLYLPISWFAS